MSVLSDTARARLGQIARLMLPGGSGMPGADEIDLAGAPVDGVLAIDPTRIAGLTALLERCGDVVGLDDLTALRSADPDGFTALAVVLANAYFMDPAVRASIGYAGQEARDSSGGLTAEDEALLADVRGRGPIYREA